MLPWGAKGILLLAFFAAGSVCLIAAFGITWARWLDPAEERFHPVIWILLGLEHYRRQVLQPDWKVQQETMEEGLAALTWTFRDEADFPWFGVLLMTPGEEGTRWVRLWMGGNPSGNQPFLPPGGAPAPARMPGSR